MWTTRFAGRCSFGACRHEIQPVQAPDKHFAEAIRAFELPLRSDPAQEGCAVVAGALGLVQRGRQGRPSSLGPGRYCWSQP